MTINIFFMAFLPAYQPLSRKWMAAVIIAAIAARAAAIAAPMANTFFMLGKL